MFTQRELRWLDEILPSMARARKGSKDSNDNDEFPCFTGGYYLRCKKWIRQGVHSARTSLA